MTQRSPKKHIAGAVTAPTMSEIQVPVSVEPSEHELSEVLSTAADDSVLTNRETWMFRWGIFGSICLVGLTCIVITYRLTLAQWESGSTVDKQQFGNSPVITIAPTPSSASFDRSGITVRVINASGVAGRARTVLDALLKRGYQDGGVETAPIQKQTVVYVSADSQLHSGDILQDILTDADIRVEAPKIEGQSQTVKIILGTQ